MSTLTEPTRPVTTPAAPVSPSRGNPAAVLGRLVRRSLRHDVRSVDGLVVSIALPVAMMAVFVYVFGGAITTGSSGLDYVDFVVPAVLLMAAGYGAALTAASVAQDLNNGIMDRFRTLPIGGWTIPASHVVASLARNVVATAIAMAAAVGLGFRSDASLGSWLLTLAIVVGYILAVSSLAVVWGLLVRSVEAAGAFTFFAIFFPYVSDGFVPAETMPAVLRGVAEHQPVTPIVTTLRALLLDLPLGNAGWLTAAWLAGCVAVSLPIAAFLFRRRTRS